MKELLIPLASIPLFIVEDFTKLSNTEYINLVNLEEKLSGGGGENYISVNRQLLELDEFLTCFPLLKNRDKLYMQDKIWQKICADMGIEEIPQVGGVISIKNQRRHVHPAYSDSYRVGPVDVQLIVKEQLPDYTEIDGVRIANFGYSISQKIGLTTDLHSKLGGKTPNHRVSESIDEQYHKHISDMKEMIIKFNSLKWKQPA